jgi:hypothetical protein
MLFGPKWNQRRQQIAPDGGEPVDAGVAGGAEGDEPFPGMLAGAAMMDMDPPGIRVRCGTGLAAKPVAEQDGFPVTAEAGF